MYGAHFLRSMDELSAQIEHMTGTIDDFTINGDGYVIEAGTEGTINEAPIKELDSEGQMAFTSIGDTNADFKVGIASTFAYKDFSLYFLFDWKKDSAHSDLRFIWKLFIPNFIFRLYLAVNPPSR